MTRIGAGWNSDNRHKHFLSQTPKTRSIQHEHAPSPSPRFSELRPCRCRKTFSTAQTSARIWIQFRRSTGSAENCIRRPWPSWHSSKLQGTIHWLHKIDETMCIKFRAWPKLAKIVRKIASLLATVELSVENFRKRSQDPAESFDLYFPFWTPGRVFIARGAALSTHLSLTTWRFSDDAHCSLRNDDWFSVEAIARYFRSYRLQYSDHRNSPRGPARGKKIDKLRPNATFTTSRKWGARK